MAKIKALSFEDKVNRISPIAKYLFLFLLKKKTFKIISTQENSRIEREVSSRDFNSQKQPFLLVLGTQLNPLSYHLVLDQKVVDVGTKSEHAFRLLFASFFVFQLEYPPYLKSFFKLFEDIVFCSSKASAPASQAFLNLLDAMLKLSCNNTDEQSSSSETAASDSDNQYLVQYLSNVIIPQISISSLLLLSFFQMAAFQILCSRGNHAVQH